MRSVYFLLLAFFFSHSSQGQADTNAFVVKLGNKEYKTGYIKSIVKPGDVIIPNWGFDPVTHSATRLPDDTVIIADLHPWNEANIYFPDYPEQKPGINKHITVANLADSVCSKQIKQLFKEKVSIQGPKGKEEIEDFSVIVHYSDGTQSAKTIKGNCVWEEKEARDLLNTSKKIACVIFISFYIKRKLDIPYLYGEGMTFKVVDCP